MYCTGLLLCIVASLKLTFLWQLTSAGEVIMLESAKRFWSMGSFVTVFDCPEILSVMCNTCAGLLSSICLGVSVKVIIFGS